MIYGDTPLGMLANLGSFGLLIAALALVLARVHGRGLTTLLGPPLAALHQFRRATLPLIGLFLAVELLPPYWSADYLADIRPALQWIALLPLALAALLIQTGAEELYYRGYLQQQLAAWNSHPAVWMLGTNLIFAFAHLNTDAPHAVNLQYMAWAFCFGLAASDLTARSGTLGPALAFHLVNNAYAFLFFGAADGADSGLALLLFEPDAIGDPFADMPAGGVLPLGFLADLALIGLMWLAARVAIRR
jgi:membrane protease YdiL (CAAX protease family)